MTQTAQTREALVEVMARAICKVNEVSDDVFTEQPLHNRWIEDATAALAALEAAGVRLVPEKCTDDMAGYAGARAEARGDIRMLPGEYRHAWEAMLAASPYAKDTP